MKQIEGINLVECYQLAAEKVRLKLQEQIVDSIAQQIMATEQLKIKANNSVTESEKLQKQLKDKEENLASIFAGNWKSVPETAKERSEKAEETKGQDKV